MLECNSNSVRFEVFTAVTLKNAVFWDVTLCGSCKNWRFGQTYHLHHQGAKNWQIGMLAVTSNQIMLCSVLQLLVIVNVVTSQKTVFFSNNKFPPSFHVTFLDHFVSWCCGVYAAGKLSLIAVNMNMVKQFVFAGNQNSAVLYLSALHFLCFLPSFSLLYFIPVHVIGVSQLLILVINTVA
jgi:hypothetical protein